MTTDKNRTIWSALGQLAGIYPNNTEAVLDWISPGSNPIKFKKTSLTATENYVTRLSEESCPLFGTVHDNVR